MVRYTPKIPDINPVQKAKDLKKRSAGVHTATSPSFLRAKDIRGNVLSRKNKRPKSVGNKNTLLTGITMRLAAIIYVNRI